MEHIYAVYAGTGSKNFLCINSKGTAPIRRVHLLSRLIDRFLEAAFEREVFFVTIDPLKTPTQCTITMLTKRTVGGKWCVSS